jgi:hypothetical protein
LTRWRAGDAWQAAAVDTGTPLSKEVLMDDNQYRNKLLIYAVLIVVASICSFGTPLLIFFKPKSSWAIALALIAIILFLYATVWFGSYLQLNALQWLATVLLLLVSGAGSSIYLITRKPNPPVGARI